MPSGRVWCEVEVAADIDWTPIAAAMPTRDLRAMVPSNGFYRFPRPANQGGEWIIAGAIRVIRVLSADDVQAVLDNGASFPVSEPVTSNISSQ